MSVNKRQPTAHLTDSRTTGSWSVRHWSCGPGKSGRALRGGGRAALEMRSSSTCEEVILKFYHSGGNDAFT